MYIGQYALYVGQEPERRGAEALRERYVALRRASTS